jgi:mycothiol maleylpyruvate isomerase-like protein
VPTCPDWTLQQLFRHVGRGNRRRRRSSPTRDGKPPEDPDAAIDCRNRPPTRYQGAAEIVASPDLSWHGANRCKFVTWISAKRCFEQTRAFGAHRVVRRSGPHPPRIQQEARKIVDSALNASTEASN